MKMFCILPGFACFSQHFWNFFYCTFCVTCSLNWSLVTWSFGAYHRIHNNFYFRHLVIWNWKKVKKKIISWNLCRKLINRIRQTIIFFRSFSFFSFIFMFFVGLKSWRRMKMICSWRHSFICGSKTFDGRFVGWFLMIFACSAGPFN